MSIVFCIVHSEGAKFRIWYWSCSDLHYWYLLVFAASF